MTAFKNVPIPVSKWDPNPFLTALNRIVALSGQPAATVAAQACLTWWNDPCLSALNGTGAWDWMVSWDWNISQVGVVSYIASSAGNATIGLGVSRASPAPIFTNNPFVAANVFQSSSPVHMGGGGSGLMNGGNGSTFMGNQVMGTNPATFDNDFLQILRQTYGGPGGSFFWFYDPQTSLSLTPLPGGGYQGYGSGIWKIRGIATNAGNNIVLCEASGCSLNSNGGAPAVPPPSSFGGWQQVKSLWY